MYCKNCGTKSDDIKKFCTNCGTAFPAASTHAAAVRPPMPKEKWTVGRVIKIIIAVVFIGGLILFKAFNSIDNSAVEKNNQALDAYNSGNNEQAIAQFQQASQDAVSNTNKMNSLKNLAYAYSSENKNDLALSTFKEALVLASTDTLDYYLISGEIALLEGKPNAALIAYNKAYAKDPDSFQVNNALNLFYLDIEDKHPESSDVTKALPYALKADQTQPSNLTKQNLGIAYHLNEKYQLAIPTLLSSGNITGQPYLAYWLGLAYAGDEQPINAKYYLKIAINGGVPVPQEVRDYINNN